jgi:hypothetical protein
MIPPGEEYNTFTAIRDTVDTFLTIILHTFLPDFTLLLCVYDGVAFDYLILIEYRRPWELRKHLSSAISSPRQDVNYN